MERITINQAAPLDRAVRIAFFLSDLGMGGAERNIVNLARVFQQRGHRIDMVLVRRKGALLDEVPDPVNVVELGMASWPAALAGLWRQAECSLTEVLALAPHKLPVVVRGAPAYVDYLKRNRPDAVLTSLVKNNVAAVWCAAAAGTGTRTVIREATHLSGELGMAGGPFDRVLPALVRRWYPLADAVVTVSDGVADDLAQTAGIDRSWLTTIHNSVDIDRVVARAGEAPDHPWLADDGEPVLVAVGRLAPEKDYPTLLRAFAKARRSRPLRLLILGEGPERNALEALSRTLEIDADVDLPGQMENPYAHFARAALLVSSSTWEGFPNAVLEALACGCPVAATDCPGGLRELADDGAYARLAPVGDPDGLAAAVLETLDMPRDAARLRERAGCFSLENAADRYLELLIGRPAEHR